MSAGNQDDVLSLMGSDQDNYSDIEELFGEKPRTRSADETSKKTRGVKRKTQTSTSTASANAPPTRACKQRKTAKSQSETFQEINVHELKNQLGIDKILQSISSLSESVKQVLSDSTARKTCNDTSTGPSQGYNSNDFTLHDMPNLQPRNLVSIPDYDSHQTPDDFDFDLDYLNCPVSPSIEGVYPQETLKGILNDDSIQITIDNSVNNTNEWDIPQLNATEKTDPIVTRL